jgi:type VI secretion system protein ImpE
MSVEAAEQALRDADVAGALRRLQDQVRTDPSDAELRVFLFQLLAVAGQWQRAITQLNVAAELDAKALAMAQMYREALQCEMLRGQVFAGKKSPVVFGQPEGWLALLIEALLVKDTARAAESATLRERAFEAAPTTTGTLDGKAFEWLADADARLGPVCEAIINGRYYWLPFARLARIDIDAPVDLRDLVWAPAHFQFANGGEAVGVIPSRYPGSERSQDGAICLARKTIWNEPTAGVYEGLGQRLLTTEEREFPLLDVRSIVLNCTPEEGAGASANG